MIWIQTMSTVLITQRARLEMVPTSQIRVVVKQMEQIFLFLHHRCRREKNSYTLSKSQLLYEATTSIGIGRKKNETEIPVFFFLVPWENAESSFEDSVVKKKIMNNISYTL